ncbi:F420-nonreducing hydrogenase [Candidatus Bathyarchaeota archaeon]|nr:F420-nonreducing hydrogenase [Candidatus Bathyarchaeota archaeon]
MKTRIATIALASCAGCHVALASMHENLLSILSEAELLHSYILMDSKTLPKELDVTLVEGSVRTNHDEELLKEAREKSKILIAVGSCSCFGGISSLGNLIPLDESLNFVYKNTPSTVNGFIPREELPEVQYSVKPIDAIVNVDYKVPGCPPEVNELCNFLSSLLKGKEVTTPKVSVCDECNREKTGIPPSIIKRIHKDYSDPKKCLLEQGYLCFGPITKGGCEAKCPNVNMPCEGCRGLRSEFGFYRCRILDNVSEKLPKNLLPFLFNRFNYGSTQFLWKYYEKLLRRK